jgi:hypothetical protein
MFANIFDNFKRTKYYVYHYSGQQIDLGQTICTEGIYESSKQILSMADYDAFREFIVKIKNKKDISLDVERLTITNLNLIGIRKVSGTQRLFEIMKGYL